MSEIGAEQIGTGRFWTGRAERAERELDDLLVDALLSGEPVVFPGPGDRELDELLNPNSGLRGKTWFDALEVIATRAGAERVSAFVAPAAALDLADVEADVAQTLESIRRDLPGIRIVAIPEHRGVEALTRRDDPLREEIKGLLDEAGFDADEAAEQVESAMSVHPYGLMPRAAMGGYDYDPDTSKFKPSGRMWGVVFLSSGLANDGRPLLIGDGVAADPRRSVRPDDLEAAVAFVNDHEFAHLVTEHLRPEWISETSRDRYLKENIADTVAIMRAVQRWGPERAEGIFREVVGMRHEGLLRYGDIAHWTVPALEEAFTEAKDLHREGRLVTLSFVDMVRHSERRLVAGADGLAIDSTAIAVAEDGIRWPVMSKDLAQDLESEAASFNVGGSYGVRSESGRVFRGALESYAEFRLSRGPLGDCSERAAGDARKSTRVDFAAKAIPILNEIGKAREKLICAGMRSGVDIVDDAAEGVAGVASGLRKIIALDAKLRPHSDAERVSSRGAIQALKGLELAIGDARDKEDRPKAIRIIESSAAVFQETVDRLPERLKGLELTIDSVLKDREKASRLCEAWMDGLSLSGIGRSAPKHSRDQSER
jgi:hypothetical protein